MHTLYRILLNRVKINLDIHTSNRAISGWFSPQIKTAK